jgi:DNA-directed RNA polymerase subunit K/omega
MSKKSIKKEESDDEMTEELDDTEDNDLDEDDYEDEEDEIQEDEYKETDTICQIDKMIDDDNEYFDNFELSEIREDSEIKIVKKEDRISANRLTKYEMVRILGERTKQLTMGAKPLIKNYESLSYDKIAEEELKLNMIPYKIKRPLPNGKFEIWTLDELYKDHLLSII